MRKTKSYQLGYDFYFCKEVNGWTTFRYISYLDRGRKHCSQFIDISVWDSWIWFNFFIFHRFANSRWNYSEFRPSEEFNRETKTIASFERLQWNKKRIIMDEKEKKLSTESTGKALSGNERDKIKRFDYGCAKNTWKEKQNFKL